MSKTNALTKHITWPPWFQNMEIELVSSPFPHLGIYNSLEFIGKQKTFFAITIQFRYMLNGHIQLFNAFHELFFQWRNHSGSAPPSLITFNPINDTSPVFFFLCKVIVLSSTVLPCFLHHYLNPISHGWQHFCHQHWWLRTHANCVHAHH